MGPSETPRQSDCSHPLLRERADAAIGAWDSELACVQHARREHQSPHSLPRCCATPPLPPAVCGPIPRSRHGPSFSTQIAAFDRIRLWSAIELEIIAGNATHSPKPTAASRTARIERYPCRPHHATPAVKGMRLQAGARTSLGPVRRLRVARPPPAARRRLALVAIPAAASSRPPIPLTAASAGRPPYTAAHSAAAAAVAGHPERSGPGRRRWRGTRLRRLPD
jgi:hypothetical protein